ncbi:MULTISPECIES: ligase-associated DNA damage response endonuclease PdeM [unclassified Achromobacter]|uniref:ligase-associated DNA damage response endonuclease PdeM n=1 Tax=unclassified Achromobacter TaxID=2626865 RepID=UPI000B51BA73|nr:MULTISPECIES: ligase-associated DNA damage response endonuclease PdeM [unclassified Achromobacter]OWT80639.1 DEAD/DEAH box helicase [Achromobacter sp. HZ34]OWT82521.1 DEAD/DEAH box helicase [Achromobacter sp. HZ28]
MPDARHEWQAEFAGLAHASARSPDAARGAGNTHAAGGEDGALTHATAVDVKGERVYLLPQRAIWWPAQQALLLADPHFGKAAAYRSLGQPVPKGTTAATLARLDTLLSTLPVRLCVVLGDFLHARAARAPATLAALQSWRDRHPQLHGVLVRGNHDSHAGDPPAELGFDVVDEPYRLGPFDCRHHPPVPGTIAAGRYAWAGHLHPSHILRGRGRDSVRLPCFVLDEDHGILPAFGAFTGTWPVEARVGRRIYVMAEDRVLAAPNR